MRLTRLRKKNLQENVAVQELRKTKKVVGKISNEGACVKTKSPAKAKGTSTSKKLEVESSPEQFEILSVKEENGEIVIEIIAPSTFSESSAGSDDEEQQSNQPIQDKLAEIKVEDEMEFDATSISVQLFPTTDAERHNYQTVYSGGSTAIKVEDEVNIKIEDEIDVKIEDEMEFCFLNSTAQFISGAGNEEHNNKPIQDKFEEIKVDEFDGPNISVQSFSATDDDDLTEIDKMEFCNEAEREALNTTETTVIDKQCKPEGKKKKSEFICDICLKQFTLKGNMKQHRTRHGKRNFVCTVCGMTKFTQSEVDRHMKMHDTNPIYFTCDICPKKYVLKSDLNEHRLRHGKPNFVCTVCGVAKFTQKRVDRHMRTHDTKWKALLSQHGKIHDTRTNPILFTCDLCSRQFITERNRDVHRLRHRKRNFDCTVCGVTKFTQYELNRHMRMHINKPKYFPCDTCHKKFSTRKILYNHRRRHGIPKLECPLCDVVKLFPYDLDRHMRITHDTNMKFQCDICSKKYFDEWNLNEHRLRHGKPNFNCTVCGATKFTKSEMKVHMKVHDTNRGQLKCPQCPQLVFSYKYAFDLHVRATHLITA